ncbi:MAG: DUF5723 family protein [Sporocytophaga sp.]|nr:DUF5723 family protein [Sporocytophaga sp.]
MRTILTALFIFSTGIFASAQNNMGTRYCNYNDLNASKYSPSELDLGNKHAQIGINSYVWMGNTTFDYKTATEIYQKGLIQNQDVNKVLSKLNKENLFGAGLDFQLLGVAVQFKTKSEKKLAFSLGVNERSGTSFLFGENFLKLALKGNKQFAGQRVDLGPASLNVNYLREYALGAAIPVFGKEDGFGIRAGVRLKYLAGIGSIYMRPANGSMYTDPEGRFIDFDFNYKVQTSGIDNINLWNSNGKGYGADAGVTVFVNKYLQFTTSILDIGAVKYDKDVTTNERSGQVKYEGLIISRFFGSQKYSTDTLAQIFDPIKTKGGSYKTPLSTRLVIEGKIKTPRTSKKDDQTYNSNTIFFTYIQGFQNLPGSTTKSFFSIGYNHDFHRVFNGGVLLSAGGYNRRAIGAFFSFKIGQSFKWGFSSDNLTGFIFPEYGKGADLATNISVAF